ncbi:YlmH family RNA-binding protein [Enterococcus timonensis]|uniref:YlmH family RNA-binding protein n=1 Tax=Enterococcus timonensis TaxID=1852364 RepID=UPI0008DB1BDA|nr:RNA-binding protein [Enterococcus timonensis]
MDETIYQHFRKSESNFIDEVGNWLETVESQYAPYLTDFLDPRQMYILETLIRQNSELSYSFNGGYRLAERARCLIYPEYFTPSDEDYNLTLIEIVYPTKFAKLSHGKILGTLMSTGLKREFFGDIMTNGLQWQFFVATEMKNFVTSQVDKIGRVGVRFEERDYTDLIMPIDAWEIEQTTLSSLRLDVVIAGVYNISRQRAKELVEQGKVKVNWTENTHPDFGIELLDILSIRGYGRIQLRNIEGKTKKEKIRLEIGVLRK